LYLCFVYEDADGLPLSVNREIQGPFPKSQHLSVAVDIEIIIPTIDKPFMSRWNLRKAKWSVYKKYVEENINRIKPIPENYFKFIKLIKTAVEKSISREYRHSYSCWTKECESLLQEYERDENEVTANRLVCLLDKERKKRWLEKIDEMYITHSSRESWSLLRKLEATQPA